MFVLFCNLYRDDAALQYTHPEMQAILTPVHYNACDYVNALRLSACLRLAALLDVGGRLTGMFNRA